MMKNAEELGQRKSIPFKEFKQYCEKLVPLLNDTEAVDKQNIMSLKDTKKRVLSYTASYKVLNRRFAKQHDCEYLEIQQLYEISQPQSSKKSKVMLKINITYSLSYQIPLLMFMPYHIVTNYKHKIKENTEQQTQSAKCQEEETSFELIPFNKEEISQIINQKIGSDKLNPSQDQTGVFVIQNPINKEYFYTLHHCYMDTYQMNINQIIPYYLALIGCHPEIFL